MSENQQVQNVEIYPSNQKSTYNAFDTLDFVIDGFENRSILPNSICIEGDFRTNMDAGGNRNTLSGVYFDDKAGLHSLIDSVFVETQNQNQIESITNYPRMVSMKNSANMSRDDVVSLDKICECVLPSRTHTNEILSGSNVPSAGANAVDNRDIPFSLKPFISVNRTQTSIPFTKTGSIKLSIILARNNDFFYGLNNLANSGNVFEYILSNVVLKCKTVPLIPSHNSPIILNVVYSIKNSINSSFMNISAKVPSIVKSVNASFMKQSQEGSPDKNVLEQQILPDLQSLQFYFNDAVSGSNITYTIDTINEMKKRYLESWGGVMPRNSVSSELSNTIFGIGTDFKANVPLMNDSFNIQIRSGANNNDSYLIYLYFYGLVQI